MRVWAQWPFPQADYPRQRLGRVQKEGERRGEPQKGRGGGVAAINAVLCAA